MKSYRNFERKLKKRKPEESPVESGVISEDRQWFFNATKLMFGHNMHRIEVIFIAKFQTVRLRKPHHAKVIHGSAQVPLHPIIR